MVGQLKPEFGQHGSLQRLTWNERQWIFPWGLEMADSYSFFSLESGGWDSEATVLSQTKDANQVSTQVDLRLREGHWQLEWRDLVKENTVTRAAIFTAQDDNWAMDFVLRFVFRQDGITHAQIAGKTIFWDGANFYHQYPTQQVRLFHEKGQIKIGVGTAVYPDNWRQVMYVRCSPQENAWIVHLRLLPREWSREIIKLRLIGTNHLVLPDSFGRLLRLWPALGAHLRYAGEFKRFNFGRLNAIPINFVARNTMMSLTATVQFLPDKA